MDVAAYRPEEIGAATESTIFLRIEHAAFEQFVGLAYPIYIFRDPEQRMQIAQASLTILDVGLDEITRLAGAAVTFFALGKLGGYELGRGALHHLLVEPRYQLVIKRLVSRLGLWLECRGAS